MLTATQRRILTAWERCTGEHGTEQLTEAQRQMVARRASIILASANGDENTTIAKRMGIALRAVQNWRTRFKRLGHTVLLRTLRSGYSIADEVGEEIVRARAKSATQSTYEIARKVGVSQMTVVRRLRKARPKP